MAINHITRFVGAAVAMFVLAGCATERFGRATALTSQERNTYTCDDIQLELAKARGFLDQVNDQSSEFKGTDVLAFLGDFGIGNSIERSAATKSGTARIAQLDQLSTEKGCFSAVVVPTPDPSSSVTVIDEGELAPSHLIIEVAPLTE